MSESKEQKMEKPLFQGPSLTDRKSDHGESPLGEAVQNKKNSRLSGPDKPAE